MSDERVEGVAAAIAKVGAGMQGDVLATWADHTPEDQWAFREMARAALDALDAEPLRTKVTVRNIGTGNPHVVYEDDMEAEPPESCPKCGHNPEKHP